MMTRAKNPKVIGYTLRKIAAERNEINIIRLAPTGAS